MSKSTKAKRRLHDISFENTGAHLALVSKDQGGPANGSAVALVMKSMKNFSPEIIEKMQQVRVTLELPDFLQKFFHMYVEDAEILARMMGYTPEDGEEESEGPEPYEDYIQSRLESFEVMKALYENDSLADAVSAVQEEDFLAVLHDQELVEKALAAEEEGPTEATNTEVGADTPEVVEKKISVRKGHYVGFERNGRMSYGQVYSVSKSGYKLGETTISASDGNPAVLVSLFKQSEEGGWMPTKDLVGLPESSLIKVKALRKANTPESANIGETKTEVTMTEKVDDTEITVEVVSKSEFEAVNKSLEDSRTELQKALDTIETFKKEKEETIRKARKAALSEVITDEEKSEVLFKAMDKLEDDETFIQVLNVLKSLMKAVEESDLFEEKGVSDEGADDAGESAVAALLKAKYHQTKS